MITAIMPINKLAFCFGAKLSLKINLPEIAEKIVGVLERENLIEYENVKEDNEPEEENIYVDL